MPSYRKGSSVCGRWAHLVGYHMADAHTLEPLTTPGGDLNLFLLRNVEGTPTADHGVERVELSLGSC